MCLWILSLPLILFLFMLNRVKFKIYSLWLCRWKEDLLEVLFKIGQSQVFKSFHLSRLSIKHVLVTGYLTPISSMLRLQIVILLSDLRAHSLNLLLKFFLSNICYLFPHAFKKDVQAVDYILTALLRWLYYKLCAHDISIVTPPCEYYIPELFDRSKLIKCRLIQVLHDDWV